MNSNTADHESLNDSEGRIISECVPYGIIACDSRGEVIFANESAVQILDEESLEKGNMLKIMAAEDDFKKGWDELINGAVNQFSLVLQERNLKSAQTQPPNSHDNDITLRATRFENRSERSHIVLIFIGNLSREKDLSEADRLKTLVDKQNRELEKIHKQLILTEKKAAMIETAGAVAHELRQPMTTIIAAIELLNHNHDMAANPQVEKRFQIIRKQCLRMAETIKQMESLMEYRTRDYVNGRLIIDLEESSQKK
jgi:signal transduction histidine kinase